MISLIYVNVNMKRHKNFKVKMSKLKVDNKKN